MNRAGLPCRRFALLLALGSLCSGVAAQLTETPIIVAPAVSNGAIAPNADSRAMVLAVPLRNGWQVPELGGRPLMAIHGAERWQWTTTDTWPDGAVRWALARAIVPGGQEPQTDLSFAVGLGASQQANIATLLPDGGVAIDNGVLLAQVRTGAAFNVLDSVSVYDDGGTTQLVNPGSSAGIVAATKEGAALSVGPDATLTIVENGPAYALIKVEGELVDPQGQGVIDFTCRLAFTWLSRDVEVQFTVRNANIERPQHTSLRSLDLRVKVAVGNGPVGRCATPDGDASEPLPPNGQVRLYQGYSTAPTKDVLGSGTNWLSPIAKIHADTFQQEGLVVAMNGILKYSGGKQFYPKNEWMDVSGSNGGCTYTIKNMPQFWPAALRCTATGIIDVGLWPSTNGIGYTWSWRTHESRTAALSFHKGPAPSPVQVSRRLDTPIVGRIADFSYYGASDCFPYDMLTIEEHNKAYEFLGLNYVVDIRNLGLTVTRFLPTSNTGGDNNHDFIERCLVSEFLRTGVGGQYVSAMDQALWKAEWQIGRSDNFIDEQDPGPNNDQVPHTKNILSDDEHRYRGGMLLAYRMSGDERIEDSLRDEVENLRNVHISPQERSMYQTIVAIVEMADVNLTALDELLPVLRERIQFFCLPELDIDAGERGFGWDGPPGLGPRGCYVNSGQNEDEKAPGETYVTRGFISASMGPRAMFRAWDYLGTGHPDGELAHSRLLDLANYTRNELYPFFPDPVDRHMVYSYGVQQKLVNDYEDSDFHPILIAMAEAFHMTGDVGYLYKGNEQIQAFRAHGQMQWLDKRLEAQHFLRTVLDAAKAAGLL